MKPFITIIITITILFSCKEGATKKVYKPESSGNINNLLVVVDNDLWNTTVGDAIRTHIGAEVYGLPQVEPQFDLRQVPPVVFSDFVRMNRTVLKIQRAEESGVKFYTDPYATPQKMVLVSGATQQILKELIEQNAPKIIQALKKVELKEKQRRIKKSLFNTSALKSALGINLNLPSTYRIAKKEDDFFWIRRDTKTGIVSLLAYSVPWQDFETPDVFSQRVIQLRDSVAKRHIPGPTEGDFMTTEMAYTPFSMRTQIAETEVLETRSLWKVQGAFMSGPFINYSFLDQKNKRILVVEGFVYAPSEAKRDYIFELESIIKSITIQ
ncbi:MAG: DUF4837 family protein [Flavobacteriaceae bacterium]